MKAFCTIITNDYFPYAQALYTSISNFNNDIPLYVLISDQDSNQLNTAGINKLYKKNIIVCSYDQLLHIEPAADLYKKYGTSDMDSFRWSMKSIFIKFLIEEKKCEKVIYADCDLFFFNDYNFLFDELEINNVLLTPHWRSSDPIKDAANHSLLFVDGLFNAGFIGVNKNAMEAMDWWAKVCLFKCVKDSTNGQFVDQTYLNLFPILFDKIKVIRHKGCNVANWNMIDCPRSLVNDQILIDEKWPVIFIHFTNSTINGIFSSRDYILMPLLKVYITKLKELGIYIKKKENHLPVQQDSYFKRFFNKVRHRIQLVSSK